MNKKTKACVLGVLAAGLVAALPALAQPVQRAALPQAAGVPSIAPAGAANPIPAWGAFCRQYPRECAVDAAEAPTIQLNARIWSMITSVNRRINEQIDPITDERHWGVADRWDLAEDGSGDCEDIQLLKRKLLADAGLPRRAMRVTVVIDEKGEGHAVLLLRTDRGEFVLDNKVDEVLPWHRTGYVFVKREGHDSMSWVSLGHAGSPSTTANR